MQELQGALPEHVMPPALVSDAAQPLLHSLLDTNMRACFHRCPDERRHCVAAQHSISYEEEDIACHIRWRIHACNASMSYEEEDTCISYEEEDNACHMRRRIHACNASGRSRTLTALSVRCVC